jgi:arabinogalactan endo-1,4-beta-galactosidase
MGSLLEVRGADLSFTLQIEAAGYEFTDHEVVAPVEQLLARRGMNTVRLRVWVNPPPGYSDLASALVLGHRAYAANSEILLDLHFSDFWADPLNQITPKAWQRQDLKQLVDTARRYTREVITAFADQGTPVSIIQIGNEVTGGMLWPSGRVYTADGEYWDGFVQLLKAGLEGALEGATSGVSCPRTMVHIDCGGGNSGTRYFYDEIMRRGVEFDLIGLSYYPFWHGPLNKLKANLHDLAIRYAKGIVVVETSYPWCLPARDSSDYIVTRADQLPEFARFPATPAGQASYFEALRSVIETVPHGRGLGFVDWEPIWLPRVGWGPGENNQFANLTMFDWRGSALPALDAFRPGP